MFIFDTMISEKKRIDLVLRECYGIGKTHSFRIFAKFGFKHSVKMKHINKLLLASFREYFMHIVYFCFDLKVELLCRRNLQLALRIIKNNKSYRSLRHFYKLPTRGQRSHNNARTQKRKRPNWRRVPIAGKKK